MTPNILSERLSAAFSTYPGTWPELAMRSGYSVTYLQRLAKGEKSNPTVACIAALAGALNVEPAYLLGLDA